jgi:hypothetical protein
MAKHIDLKKFVEIERGGAKHVNAFHEMESGRDYENKSIFEREKESQDRMKMMKREYSEDMPRAKEPKYTEGKNLYKV